MAQKETITLLVEWKKNLRVSRGTHYETAKQLSRANYLFGIPVAVLSALVGTSILATIQSSVNVNLKLAAGLVSMLAAVLAGIHTLMRFEERAEKHRAIGARYSSIIREIDEILAFSEKGKNISRDSVKSVREQYDKVTLEAPPTSRKIHDQVLALVNAQDAKPIELNKG